MNKIQYNTEKDKLLMPEYGRNVQEMVNHCMGIENKALRQQCAQEIVSVMATIEQENVESPEVQSRLWNHLALMSGFRLDVDYPVDIIPQEEVTSHPSPMSLPQKDIRHRHYGRIVEKALMHLKDMPEGEERDALVRQTADRMRQNLFTWNADAMSEEKVSFDIDSYAPGQNLSNALQGHQYAGLHTLPTNILKKKKKK